jgi:hypothetical protein
LDFAICLDLIPPPLRRRPGSRIKNFAQWIQHEPVERWSLLHDAHGARFGCMTTNLAESYNFVVRGNRALMRADNHPVGNPSVRNQGLSVQEKAKLQKVMLTSLLTLQQGRRLQHLLTRLQPVATRNLHTTQPNTLLPTYDKVVNLTGLLETKE